MNPLDTRRHPGRPGPARFLGVLAMLSGCAHLMSGCVRFNHPQSLDTGGSGESDKSNCDHPSPLSGVVEPLYPDNGRDWNDYVADDAASPYTADDSICTAGADPTTGCHHGGEMRVVVIPGEDNCTGLEAEDAMAAFEWHCDDSTGTARFITTRLKDEKGLRDLIDLDTLSWKTNSVEVTDACGNAVISTDEADWGWSNTIVEDNSGGTLGVAGQIYVVRSDPAANIDLAADRVSLLIDEGVTLTGSNAGNESDVIQARGEDFVWIEGGTVDATGDERGVTLAEQTHYSMIRNITVENADTDVASGVVIDDGHFNRVIGIDSTNNAQDGVEVVFGAQYNTLKNINVSGNGNWNLVIGGADASFNVVEGLTATGGNIGLALTVGAFEQNEFKDIVITNPAAEGIYIRGPRNTFEDVTITGALVGIDIGDTGDENEFRNLRISNSTGHGIQIDTTSSADANRFTNVVVANSGNDGIYVNQSDDNVFVDVAVSNNERDGIDISNTSDRNTLVNITSAHNDGRGFMFYTGSDNRAFNLTVTGCRVNVFDQGGVYFEGGSNAVFYNVASSAQSADGFEVNGGSPVTVFNLATANSSDFGVLLDSTTASFHGHFKIGNNGMGACSVTASTGLTDGTCTSPSANLETGVTLATSFTGKVTADDSANLSDLHNTDTLFGYQEFAQIQAVDWTRFDTFFRLWGLDGTPFTADASRRRCETGSDCRIWDWSMSAAAGVIRGVNSVPDGNDTLTHTWSDASTITFLRNAVEMMGDEYTGNKNAFCEAGETCLYTPNIGSYQGHGELIPLKTITTGTLTGITLVAYESNGVSP